jgi:hypothetical protein
MRGGLSSSVIVRSLSPQTQGKREIRRPEPGGTLQVGEVGGGNKVVLKHASMRHSGRGKEEYPCLGGLPDCRSSTQSPTHTSQNFGARSADLQILVAINACTYRTDLRSSRLPQELHQPWHTDIQPEVAQVVHARLYWTAQARAAHASTPPTAHATRHRAGPIGNAQDWGCMGGDLRVICSLVAHHAETLGTWVPVLAASRARRRGVPPAALPEVPPLCYAIIGVAPLPCEHILNK